MPVGVLDKLNVFPFLIDLAQEPAEVLLPVPHLGQQVLLFQLCKTRIFSMIHLLCILHPLTSTESTHSQNSQAVFVGQRTVSSCQHVSVFQQGGPLASPCSPRVSMFPNIILDTNQIEGVR